MSALSWVLLILAALVVAFLIWLVIQFKTFQRGAHHNKTYRVDGDEVKVKIHFAGSRRTGEPPQPPRLLRWLKKEDFVMLGHIWVWRTAEAASRLVLGHGLTHRTQQHVLGGPLYVLTSLGQWATQWVHDRRGMEEEANRAEKLLAATGTAMVVVWGKARLIEAPFLMDYRNP